MRVNFRRHRPNRKHGLGRDMDAAVGTILTALSTVKERASC